MFNYVGSQQQNSAFHQSEEPINKAIQCNDFKGTSQYKFFASNLEIKVTTMTQLCHSSVMS